MKETGHFPLVPVTLLTGFLGAGKTTLLNHLLSTYKQERIVIVENEFGPVNIDAHLLDHHTEIELIELTNGCICCTVHGELTKALLMLIERKQSGESVFDRLILETTGLADPAPILQTFFIDEALTAHFQLDAVVTLVDGEHAQMQLDQHRVAVSQIGFADRLILTKLDRIDLSHKLLLIERLRQINVRAEILEATHGEVHVESWLGINAFHLNSQLGIEAAAYSQKLTTPRTYFSINPEAKDSALRSWNDDIASHAFVGTEMDIDRIGQFMEETIAQYGNDMLRFKGVFAIQNEARRLLVQGVHRVVGFDYGVDWQAEEERRSLFVVIGRGLPIAQLNTAFMACQVK